MSSTGLFLTAPWGCPSHCVQNRINYDKALDLWPCKDTGPGNFTGGDCLPAMYKIKHSLKAGFEDFKSYYTSYVSGLQEFLAGSLSSHQVLKGNVEKLVYMSPALQGKKLQLISHVTYGGMFAELISGNWDLM